MASQGHLAEKLPTRRSEPARAGSPVESWQRTELFRVVGTLGRSPRGQ